MKRLFFSNKKSKKHSNVKTIYDYIPALDKDESLELFKEIRVGDIIYAPTSYKLSTLKKLEESHRQRPYIIVKKGPNHLEGFCGTSDTKTNYILSFNLYKDSYDVSKDGIIDLTNIHNIRRNSILSINGHLSISDMLKINELIYASSLENKIMFDIRLKLAPGMIISESYKSKFIFFVYKVDDKNITLFRFDDKKRDVRLSFNKKTYYINTKEPIVIDKRFKYVILKANDFNTIKNIDSSLKDNKQAIVKTNRFETSHYFKYKIGQVFVVGMRTFVYLFSSYSEDYGIEIYEDESISYLMRIEQYSSYMRKDGILEKEEIIDVVNETAKKNGKCKWLYDYVLELFSDSNPYK